MRPRSRDGAPPGPTVGDHLASLAPVRPLAADVDRARFGPYRGYAEQIARLARLASGTGASGRPSGRPDAGPEARPNDRPRVVSIGASVHGRPLFAVDIGPADAPAVTALLAGIHPIEWIGVEVGLALIERLAAAPPRDRRVLAVPMVNPDGYARVEADLRAGRRRWRRGNARGVDLNRNWPTHFRPRRRAARRWRWPAGYNDGGPHPLSEPEPAAVTRALDAASAPVDLALSLHSIGRMILVPYGGRWTRSPRHGQLVDAAAAVRARLSRRYTVRQCARWVPGAFARGIEIDHLHAHYGATALLVECTRGGVWGRSSRPLVSSLTQPFCWFNPGDPAPEIADLVTALEPFVRGQLFPRAGA